MLRFWLDFRLGMLISVMLRRHPKNCSVSVLWRPKNRLGRSVGRKNNCNFFFSDPIQKTEYKLKVKISFIFLNKYYLTCVHCKNPSFIPLLVLLGLSDLEREITCKVSSMLLFLLSAQAQFFQSIMIQAHRKKLSRRQLFVVCNVLYLYLLYL